MIRQNNHTPLKFIDFLRWTSRQTHHSCRLFSLRFYHF